EVVWGVARLRALVLADQVLGEDVAVAAGVGHLPEWRRVLEVHLDRVVVDLVDRADVRIRAQRGGGGRLVDDVFVGEDDIVRGEGLAVVPGDILLQLPGDRLAVLVDGALVDTRHLRGEDREDLAVWVEGGQRFGEQARAVVILGAGREMRVEQHRRLPPQHLDRATAAALGRVEGIGRRLRRRRARGRRLGAGLRL